MEVWLNGDLSRNRAYRPYIDQEELYRNVPLYDPNGSGPHYSLYDRAQPPCMNWRDRAFQFIKSTDIVPDAGIDKFGRYHNFSEDYRKPTWVIRDRY